MHLRTHNTHQEIHTPVQGYTVRVSVYFSMCVLCVQ